jgi:hypothetical protein
MDHSSINDEGQNKSSSRNLKGCGARGKARSMEKLFIVVMHIEYVAKFHLQPLLSHSPAPRCKIGVFLSLRAVCADLNICCMTMLIDRLNMLSNRDHLQKKSQVEAITDKTMSKVSMGFARRIILSGWIHQCWPSHIVHMHKSLNGQTVQLRMGNQGIPRGMRQKYFDEANSSKRVLGWKQVWSTEGNPDHCVCKLILYM